MKLYKKIVYSVLAMTLVGNTLSSCSDFLDEELTTQLSTLRISQNGIQSNITYHRA